jgi:hypothetical protein
MSEELQKCSKCGCNKLLKFFKIRENTGKIYKTCISCCERFKCDFEDCEYTCALSGNLKRHIKQIHDNIKDFECDFEDCKYTCSTNSILQQHIKRIHDKIKDYECNLCEYKCSTNGDLKRHIKQVHDKIKDYECELCDYKCSTNTDLQIHIKAVHNKIKDIKCELCDYKCSTNSSLQKHILICKGENHTNISGLELRTKEALEQLGFLEDIDYIFNSTYSKLTDYCGRHLRPDFRFFDYKIIIEADGEQHFKSATFGGISRERAEKKFKLTQERDQIKNNFCEKFGYKMIRISYKDIKDTLSILHSELDEVINY